MQLPVGITELRLKNVRGFSDLTVPIVDSGSPGSPRRVTLVIGKNGTNKSTLLRAIALCLADDTEVSAMLSFPIGSMVRDGTERSTIEIDAWGPDATLRRVIGSSGGKDYLAETGSHILGVSTASTPGMLPVFVCGYGAGRTNVGSDTGREYRIADACASLFDYRREMIDPELTLRRLNDFMGTTRYQSLMTGIKHVLDLGEDDSIELLSGGGIRLFGPSMGSGIPLDGWADGYRLTLLWLLDLFGRAMRADQIGSDGQIHGIVLIDEIDQHLHPSLQAAIIPRLAAILPMTQIIATTHSPLVALGADPGQLVVLRRDHDVVVQEENVPDYRGYSAEDMLSDDRLFASAVYSPDTEQQIARYEELVSKGSSGRSDAEELELGDLVRVIQAQPLPTALDEKVTQALADIGRRMESS